MKRIFVVEDDPTILAGLEMGLTMNGYDVISSSDGEEAYQQALRESFDLIILDVSLPSKNGLYICRDLRKDGVTTPIMMLTSRSEEMDKVMGLDSGADDYLTKPFSLPELLARLNALLRRTTMPAASSPNATETARTEESTYTFGDVTVHVKRQDAELNGKPIGLTTKEFQILHFLIKHEREVVSRDMLLNEVWGYESFPTTRTVDNYILALRQKIEPDHDAPRHLLTVHGAGYRFVKDPS